MPADGQPGFGERVRRRLALWRNGLLASHRFQRWASRFPPTRGIARRRAARLFDLCAGFVYSQILLAVVRLRLLEMLADAPADVATLAARLDIPADRLEQLLAGAASLGLVEAYPSGRYGLGAEGAVLLGQPGLTAMIEHHERLYRDLADPVRLLRGPAHTDLGGYWPYAGEPEPTSLPGEAVAGYSRLMAATQAPIAEAVIDAYPFARHRRVVDVGGGEGAFLIAVAKALPDIRGNVLDLPAVADRARERIAAAGLDDRLSATGGDFRCARAWPEGADLVTFVRILHDHDDATVAALLAVAVRRVTPGGTVLIAEPTTDGPGAARVGGAYFGMYLMAMGSGRPRSTARLEALLRAAGCVAVRRWRTPLPMQVQVVSARTPTKGVN